MATTLLLLWLSPAFQVRQITSAAPQTKFTVGGTTFVAYNVSASDIDGPSATTVTIELECRRPTGGISAVPTCTLSTLGANSVLANVCSGLSVASLPKYCAASSAVNFEQTQTFSGESQYYINNYPLVITAGTEKLGASAAAAPSTGSASATGAAAGSASTDGAAASQPGSGGSGPAEQSTAAAAPLRTMVPALAGLGAAVGAFFS